MRPYGHDVHLHGKRGGYSHGLRCHGAAILYGAKANRTGDGNYAFTTRGADQYNLDGTVYLSTSYHTRQTIWDSGGLNTLDCTNLPYNSSGYRLDLRDLGWLWETMSTIRPTSTTAR